MSFFRINTLTLPIKKNKMQKLKFYYLIILFLAGLTACSLFSNNNISGNRYSDPHYCKENSEVEVKFVEAVRRKKLQKMNEFALAGVDVNGGTCKCEIVNASAGQGKWRKINICEYKPFLFYAIATNNFEVIRFFVDHGVKVNQGYNIYEWEKDFGGFHTGNIKSSLQITTLDELFLSSVKPEILDLLLSKGAKATPFVKHKIQKLYMNDNEILSILKKHGIEY
jgi:hypothetical protein